MTAPVFIAPTAVLAAAGAGSLVRLDGTEGRHAAGVRRLRAGEQIDLVDGGGIRARGVVREVIGSAALEVEVRGVDFEEPPGLRVVVLLALIKGDRFEDAVQMLTEVSVDEVIPWDAERSIVRWRGEKAVRAAQRARMVAVEASKQSRRARFPAVSPLLSTPQAVGRVAGADAVIVLHESARVPLSEVALPDRGEIVLVVGPEGGISDAELQAFSARGAVVVRMGPTVLRAATAAVSGAAIVLARCGRLDA
jgi:16S rRNA (uracil1498-N3)-methyltransferase